MVIVEDKVNTMFAYPKKNFEKDTETKHIKLKGIDGNGVKIEVMISGPKESVDKKYVGVVFDKTTDLYLALKTNTKNLTTIANNLAKDKAKDDDSKAEDDDSKTKDADSGSLADIANNMTKALG